MDDTTDKSAAPEESTANEEALGDKDLGQATLDTGESQDGSDTSDKAPQDSDTEGTEDDATSEAETGEDEGQLLTPEEIAKLPTELKAQYRSMNTRFQQKMGELNTLIDRAKTITEPPKPTDVKSEDKGENVPTFIDRSKLSQAKNQDEVIGILEEGFQKLAAFVADQSVGKALAPIQQEKAAAEVDGYFKAHPERIKYREAMGRKDAATGEKLTLDELFYAVAGKDLLAAEQVRKDKKLRNLQKGNAESSSGTSGKPSGEGDIFDDIAKAGGHGNSILL
jgi:hypothetical protein